MKRLAHWLAALTWLLTSAGQAAPGATPPPALAPAGSPVALNGRLHVCGRQLCNRQGQAIQLRGMSTHGLQWYGWGTCLTPASLDALAQDWKAGIMRVSLYVQEEGYETDPVKYTRMAEQVIDALIARGLYVLIDWHMLDPGDPIYNLARARVYLGHMAQRYAGVPNVLYEIANEPNGEYRAGGKSQRVDWARIKAYARAVIPTIRQADAAGVIIVGTPDWSSFGVSGGSGPAEVYRAPLSGANLMYGFHFYAASHQAPYRRALAEAAEHLPVFVTEWGSQEYTGDGPNDFRNAQAFLALMAQRKISWTSWNYSDDERSGAAFVEGTCARGGPWNGNALKPAGVWVRDRIRQPAP